MGRSTSSTPGGPTSSGPAASPVSPRWSASSGRAGWRVVVDNDASRSTFGRWFLRGHPAYDPDAVQRFWDRRGWTTEAVTIRSAFGRREDLEAVVRIELPPAAAEAAIAEHDGLEVDYAVALRWWRGP